jgi:hypothetical protein
MVQTQHHNHNYGIKTKEISSSNKTILQKMKEDNSIRTYRKVFNKNPIKDYHYSVPHSLPIPVSSFNL